jgi:hypothetical protein
MYHLAVSTFLLLPLSFYLRDNYEMNEVHVRVMSMSLDELQQFVFSIIYGVRDAADDPFDPDSEVNGGDLIESVFDALNSCCINPLGWGENTMSCKFSLGQLVVTPGAANAVAKSNQMFGEFINRHVHGDWGDLSDDDRQVNEEAIINGSRILSAYHTSLGDKIWIITEAVNEHGKRFATTILLPEEY